MAKQTPQSKVRRPRRRSGSSTATAPSTDPKPPRGAERFGAWFDHKAADAACRFFPTYLRHTEAEWAGKPFHLAPWEANDIIRPLFGWKREDGTRLYRRVHVVVGKKNGKTELAAGVALIILVGDGAVGGQVYSGAVDKDQARIVFHKAGIMVGFSEALSQKLEVFKTSIYCPELIASFKPISGTPDTKHGFSVLGFIGDEFHAWSSGELHDIMHKNTAAWAQPIEFLISTAGVRGRGYGWELHEHAVKVRDGDLDDPELLVVIYAADPEDDINSEATWRKANPNLGISPKLEFIRAEAAAASQSPRKENDFKRFHLNIWTEQTIRWLPMDKWRASAGKVSWQELEAHLKGRDCYGAVDLSTKLDLSALVLAFPPVDDDDDIVHLLCRFFLPQVDLAERSKRDGVKYDEWAAQGALTLTPGDVIDYAWIEHQLMADAANFRIREVAFDNWNATQFATRMRNEGMTMVDHRQGFPSMSEPSKEFEALVVALRLAHGGHPVLRWMASNAAIDMDAPGNIKPNKAKSGARIDGIVAGVMAVGRAILQREDETLSFTAADMASVA